MITIQSHDRTIELLTKLVGSGGKAVTIGDYWIPIPAGEKVVLMDPLPGTTRITEIREVSA